MHVIIVMSHDTEGTPAACRYEKLILLVASVARRRDRPIHCASGGFAFRSHAIRLGRNNSPKMQQNMAYALSHRAGQLMGISERSNPACGACVVRIYVILVALGHVL